MDELIIFREVFGNSLMIWFHGFLSWPPIGRTNLTMFVGELEGLDQPQSFIDVAAYGKVIYCNLTENTFPVNDKKASEGHTVLLFVYLIRLKKKSFG